jgi:hypothetical protein
VKFKGLALSFCFTLIQVCHANSNELKEIVWDGFAYPYKTGQEEKCDSNRNPICLILESQKEGSFQDIFNKKIQDIVDNKYKFVSKLSDERGDSLHLAVSISLEWPLSTSNSNAEEESIYFLCTTILFYKSSETLTLLNAQPLCFIQGGFKKSSGDLVQFLNNMLYANTAPKAVTIEKRLLSEISEVINTKPTDLKRISIRTVKFNEDVYKNEPEKRQLLRSFVAEMLTANISKSLGKPVIPSSLKNAGKIELRFANQSKNASIELPKSSDFLDIVIQPFSKKTNKDDLGYKYEIFFAMLKLSHQQSQIKGGEAYFSNVNIFLASAPRRITQGNESDAEELKYINILRALTDDVSKQLVKPDKKWMKDHVLNSDSNLIFEGFNKLATDLTAN